MLAQPGLRRPKPKDLLVEISKQPGARQRSRFIRGEEGCPSNRNQTVLDIPQRDWCRLGYCYWNAGRLHRGMDLLTSALFNLKERGNVWQS